MVLSNGEQPKPDCSDREVLTQLVDVQNQIVELLAAQGTILKKQNELLELMAAALAPMPPMQHGTVQAPVTEEQP